MTETHPNVALLSRLDTTDFTANPDLFAEDVVFRYYNPLLPEFQGDYVGMDGLRTFFGKLAELTTGTFEVNPQSITPVGDELLVVHTINKMTLPGGPMETNVVVVWRIVEGRITEVWDIPSVYGGANQC